MALLSKKGAAVYYTSAGNAREIGSGMGPIAGWELKKNRDKTVTLFRLHSEGSSAEAPIGPVGVSTALLLLDGAVSDAEVQLGNV